MTRSRFAAFAWGVLLFCLPVIVWGAFVRASSSGDGCGSHWPLCDGQVIPAPRSLKLVIEFTHRTMSGLFGLAVAALVVWAFRAFPREHRVRQVPLRRQELSDPAFDRALGDQPVHLHGMGLADAVRPIGGLVLRPGSLACTNAGQRAPVRKPHTLNRNSTTSPSCMT